MLLPIRLPAGDDGDREKKRGNVPLPILAADVAVYRLLPAYRPTFSPSAGVLLPSLVCRCMESGEDFPIRSAGGNVKNE